MSGNFNDPNSATMLLQCPYDRSHWIMRKRFQIHMVRCSKSHLNEDKIACPFNISHLFKKEEMETHASTCAERKYYEHYCNVSPIVGMSATYLPNDATRASFEYQLPDPAESWDNDTEVPTYDPNQYAERANVLRSPVGLTPKQRKAFRLAERRRLQALDTKDF